MIIAVDGPAASGKGTIARALARHYALPHLDTGLLYRAAGVTVLRAGGNPAEEADAIAGCDFDEALLGDAELKSEVAGKAASILSPFPAVRAALYARQIAFLARPGGAILDGRDIGTVIAPHADAKLFVTASAPVRAQRRFDELQRLGLDRGYDAVLADILSRDERDSNRAASPLVRAADADLLDTSDLGIEAAVKRAIALVDARKAAGRV